jgi:hypothetical protein
MGSREPWLDGRNRLLLSVDNFCYRETRGFFFQVYFILAVAKRRVWIPSRMPGSWPPPLAYLELGRRVARTGAVTGLGLDCMKERSTFSRPLGQRHGSFLFPLSDLEIVKSLKKKSKSLWIWRPRGGSKCAPNTIAIITRPKDGLEARAITRNILFFHHFPRGRLSSCSSKSA